MIAVMQRVVFYGKGGIGKSTISSNISAVVALDGRKILHVGCDPKHDSTVSLMGGQMIQTVLDAGFTNNATAAGLVHVSTTGVHCVEAGGPQAGVGCAGRGISRTVDILRKAGLLDDNSYDAVVYDLLGDVVCGGFAAPLRRDVGEKVVIISSEEVMSLYAANNVARAVVNYAENGVVCAGLILNLRDPNEDLGPVKRFASLLNVPILGIVRREPLIRKAEYVRKPVVEYAPDAPITAQFRRLAKIVFEKPAAECVLPTPLSDEAFYRLTQCEFQPSEEDLARAAVARPSGFKSLPLFNDADELSPGSLTPAKPADDAAVSWRSKDYERDLEAGRRAVKRGLVSEQVALARLTGAYPELAQALVQQDLH